MGNLQNRFPPKIEQFWNGWHECLCPTLIHKDTGRVEYCEQNHWDAIHHIISPTAYNDYVPGKHNTSVFNSAPVNNENCHLYKPLQNRETQTALLNKVYLIVMEKVDNGEYRLTKVDYDFLRVYKKFYNFL